MYLRRTLLPAAVLCSLVVPAAAQAPTNLRMQNVLKDFVKSTGQEAVGLGSWISGKKYSDVLAAGTSDHDIRLISKATTPAELQRDWLRARAALADLVKKEFGKDADKVLKTVNLYPPSQLMKGVEDAADALGRFKKIGNVPNLGFTGKVAEAPARFAEGLYGPGSTVWTQAYEESAGRLFYTKDGKVFVGFTDLTHMSEGVATYDLRGMSNTAGQWADHIVEELRAGQGDKVAKYLERLDRDLAKAKSLARVDLDPGWRAQVRRLFETLKKNPGQARDLQGEINAVLARTRSETALLGRMSRATGPERQVLSQALGELRQGGRFAKLMGRAGEVVTLERMMTAIAVILQVRQTARFAGEGDYQQAVAAALSGVAGMASFPAALLTDVTSWVLETAKTSGYEFAASTQEAWDLMAGNFSGVGRAGVADRSYSLGELVAKIDDEKGLEALVYTRAMQAASRGFGQETGKSDQKVGEAIFRRCYPVILAAWRERRDELSVEYQTLLDGLEHTPVLLRYLPAPAALKPKEKLAITVYAEVQDPDFARRIVRAKEILTTLYRTGAFADVEWTWKGGKEGSSKDRRLFEFDRAGSFPASVAVRINAGAANAKVGQVAARRFELDGGVDIKVEDAGADLEYKYIDFNTLLQGPTLVNAKIDNIPSMNKTNEPSRNSLQLTCSDVAFTFAGDTATANFLARGEFGAEWPAKVQVVAVFNKQRTVIDRLTVSWDAVRNVPNIEQVHRWSFTATGIPMRYPADANKVEFGLDAEKPAQRPKGFQLAAASYLHSDLRRGTSPKGPYQELTREDAFQAAQAEIGIGLTFKKKPRRDPPVANTVPR